MALLYELLPHYAWVVLGCLALVYATIAGLVALAGFVQGRVRSAAKKTWSFRHKTHTAQVFRYF